MLFFRSEEHVDRWCDQWNLPRGAMLSLEQAWRLAKAWFDADRGAPGWRRPTVDEVESLFGSLGLTGTFWSLR
jgi:alkylmercury lyase-like protein